jgi:pSer/pThr/pTyr-binding forkhead associated (FHA) protein
VSSNRQTLVLSANVTPIGRENVNPGDKMISAQHARIRQQGGIFWLEDVGSMNGTYLNEQRIFEPAPLADGDMIRVGRTNLQIYLPRQ